VPQSERHPAGVLDEALLDPEAVDEGDDARELLLDQHLLEGPLLIAVRAERGRPRIADPERHLGRHLEADRGPQQQPLEAAGRQAHPGLGLGVPAEPILPAPGGQERPRLQIVLDGGQRGCGVLGEREGRGDADEGEEQAHDTALSTRRATGRQKHEGPRNPKGSGGLVR
jgi:hypothetical protein